MSSRIPKGTVITNAGASFLAKVMGFSRDGMSRGSIDVTPLNPTEPAVDEIGNREKIPSGFVDAGQLKISIHVDPNYVVPLHADAEKWTIAFPKYGAELTAAKWECDGFATDFNATGEVDGVIEGDLTLELTGAHKFIAAT